MNNLKVNNLFDVVTGFEESLCDVERVSDMLQIFDEGMENELSALEEYVNPKVADYFLNRIKMYKNLFYSVQFQLVQTSESMKGLIDAGFNIEKRRIQSAECPKRLEPKERWAAL